MNDTVISAQGLANTYGNHWKKVEAVRGVDLEVPRYEIFRKFAR